MCSKLPHEDTRQLRKLDDTHICNTEYKVKLIRASLLGKKLVTFVMENPNINLTYICSKAHEKWNVGVSRMQAYRARLHIELVDESFVAQFKRLRDYGHELLRSNANITIKIKLSMSHL